MFKPTALRLAAKAVSRPTTLAARRQKFVQPLSLAASASRPLSTTAFRRDPSDKEYDDATTAAPPGASGEHEGQFARTDPKHQFEHPEEQHYPKSQVVQGRGGEHNMRTLASFSMENKVGVVTGGARGLGLVMTQALVISGADVAIVDMNSKEAFGRYPPVYANFTVEDEADRQASQLLQSFKEENPGSEKYAFITFTIGFEC